MVKDPSALIHALTTSEAKPITVNLDKVIDPTRYSSKTKLLWVTATVMKVAQFWMNKGKKPQSWTPVEAGELNRAEEKWIQTLQQNCFSEELRVLRSGKPTTNHVINQLNLGLDNKDLIRCHGRITHAEIPQDSKTPLLLPTHHRFTTTINSIHSQWHLS